MRNKKIVKKAQSEGKKGYRGDWTEDGSGFFLDGFIWVLKEVPFNNNEYDIKTMKLCAIEEYEEKRKELNEKTQ